MVYTRGALAEPVNEMFITVRWSLQEHQNTPVGYTVFRTTQTGGKNREFQFIGE